MGKSRIENAKGEILSYFDKLSVKVHRQSGRGVRPKFFPSILKGDKPSIGSESEPVPIWA